MKKLFYIFVICGLVVVQCSSHTEATIVNYTTNNDNVANPERGFQKYSLAQASDYNLVSQNTLIGYRTNDNITVLYRSFLLDSFMTSDISQTYLDNMQIDFDRIRSAGLKVIVRFSYTDEVTTGVYQASKTQIIRHIAQLEDTLTKNKDIILSQQAGFIGQYGEWYYTNSAEFGTEGEITSLQRANRKDIILAMLAHTPLEIPLQVRAVNIKQTMFGTTQLNNTTAYQNTANARIGFYNDAFLNDYGDQGTYSVSSRYENPVGTSDYTYLANETQYLPMGGETNGINSPRTSGANAIIEMDLTNFSTLNRDYYIPNFTNRISSNHYDQIERRLGYRFVLLSGDYQFHNTILSGIIHIKNEGFASPFHNKMINLVLKKTTDSTTYKYSLTGDIRTWIQSGTLTFSQNIATINDGTYELFLEIKDPLLPTRVEYSIRFANTDTWIHDMNSLQHQINKLTEIPNNTPAPTISPSVIKVDEDTSVPYNTTTNAPLVYGTGTSGDTVTLTISGIQYTGTIQSSGYWTIRILQPLNPQQYSGTITSTNTIGIQSTGTSISITIDSTTQTTEPTQTIQTPQPTYSAGGGGSRISQKPNTTPTTNTQTPTTQPQKTKSRQIIYNSTELYNPKIDNSHCHTKKSNISIMDSTITTTNDEFKKGLAFLSLYDITIFNDIDAFQPKAKLSRQHAAKLFTKFAIHVLCKTPDTSIQPKYNDMKDLSNEMKYYITQAYQLGLMKGGDHQFKPFAEISKAEFNAILIRMIINNKLSEENSPRYAAYNTFSTNIGIIKQGADNTPISRQHATLMLSRAYYNQKYIVETGSNNALVLQNHTNNIQ